jgi:hypothetical protein
MGNGYCCGKSIEKANSFAELINDCCASTALTGFTLIAHCAMFQYWRRDQSEPSRLLAIGSKKAAGVRAPASPRGSRKNVRRQALSKPPRKGLVVEKRRSNKVLHPRARPNTFWLDTLCRRP